MIGDRRLPRQGTRDANRRWSGIAVGAVSWFLILMPPQVQAQGGYVQKVPTDCDRACLESLVDDYLAAVVAHDPSRLPLSEDVVYTEDKQLAEIGEGFWRTATSRGNYNHYFADTVMDQAGWMGTMYEGDTLLLMALRLRVQLGRITEIETSYFRPGGGGPNDIAAMEEKGAPEPLWLEPVPPDERMSRSALIDIANAYFDGVENNDGQGFYPFTDDCDRIENGAHTTNNPSGPGTPGGFNYMGEDCKGQLESGYLAIVTEIHSRRFPLVDVERGVVFAYCFFDMDGSVEEITLSSGETVEMGAFAGRATSIDVTEAFRIEKGLIRRIEMIGSSMPFHPDSAWGGLSGR
jgi:hypothetical protein